MSLGLSLVTARRTYVQTEDSKTMLPTGDGSGGLRAADNLVQTMEDDFINLSFFVLGALILQLYIWLPSALISMVQNPGTRFDFADVPYSALQIGIAWVCGITILLILFVDWRRNKKQ